MAHSETLQALQTRLADRLQAVQTEAGREAQWLAVQAGGRNYLVPLTQAGEIYPWQMPKALPYTQPWFMGVVNLRGNLMGVMDVAHFLGHPQPRTEQRLLQASIVSVHAGFEMNAAMVVDRLMGLRGQKDGLQASAGMGEAHACLGTAYVDGEGQLWQELQLQALVESPHFLHVRL